MQERIYPMAKGNIYYWINTVNPARDTLVFLPGLTADHHLFDKQINFLQTNIMCWCGMRRDMVRQDRLCWIFL